MAMLFLFIDRQEHVQDLVRQHIQNFEQSFCLNVSIVLYGYEPCTMSTRIFMKLRARASYGIVGTATVSQLQSILKDESTVEEVK